MWKQSKEGVEGIASAIESYELDKVKKELAPIAEKEVNSGDKLLKPIDFQPVISPGHYEGEFAKKDADIIFHFWPHGYHEAENAGRYPPRFEKNFEAVLKASMEKTFGPGRFEMHNDSDMGAIFVKVFSFGLSEFYRELCIEVCELIHNGLES